MHTQSFFLQLDNMCSQDLQSTPRPKRVLPHWMLAAELKSIKKKRNMNQKPKLGSLHFIHVFRASVLRKTITNAKTIIEFLKMPKSLRVSSYSEDEHSDFHFFLNFGLTAIMYISEMTEVLCEIFPESLIQTYDGFDDCNRLLLDIQTYLDIYVIQRSPVIHIISNEQ